MFYFICVCIIINKLYFIYTVRLDRKERENECHLYTYILFTGSKILLNQ
jgi:hypothetical protein